MRKTIYILLLSILALSYGCEEDMVIIATAPKFEVGEEKDLLRKSVTLCGECTTNMPNVVVGFMLGKEVDLSDGVKYPVTVEAEDGLYTLEQQITDLEIDDVYYYAMYADASGNTQLSEIKTFRTPNNSLAQVGETVYTVANTLPFSSSVVDNGGADIQGVGFCASTSPNPEVIGVNSIVKNATLETSNNTFSAVFDNIESNVTYYIRAFAYNGMGFSYGSEIEVVFDAVSISDSSFKDFLVANYDANGDNEISPAEASIVTSMTLNTDNISSLSGIESFVALEYLSCTGSSSESGGVVSSNGKLTTIDLSSNTKLTTVICDYNKLMSIDFSYLSELKSLSYKYNTVSNLIVSSAITSLDCSGNNLSDFDLSPYTSLSELYCTDNAFTTLYINNNTQLSTLWSYNNSDLIYIYVWEGFDKAGDSNFVKDEQAVYLLEGESIVLFDDDNFKTYCLENFDTNGDNQISTTESEAVTSISVATDNITTLKGVEAFVNLTSLSCCGNSTGILESLDISKNTALKNLYCNYNNLTSLDISANTALKSISCYDNELTSLDVSTNTALTSLYCYSNKLTSLDLSKNTALTSIQCHDNNLTSLDVSICTALTTLWCYSNDLTSLDISANTALTNLRCYSNELTSLDVSSCTALTHLWCYSNDLTSLDISTNTALTHLFCDSNELTSLDISTNTALTSLRCNDNNITYIYVWEGFDKADDSSFVKDDSATYFVPLDDVGTGEFTGEDLEGSSW